MCAGSYAGDCKRLLVISPKKNRELGKIRLNSIGGKREDLRLSNCYLRSQLSLYWLQLLFLNIVPTSKEPMTIK